MRIDHAMPECPGVTALEWVLMAAQGIACELWHDVATDSTYMRKPDDARTFLVEWLDGEGCIAMSPIRATPS